LIFDFVSFLPPSLDEGIFSGSGAGFLANQLFFVAAIRCGAALFFLPFVPIKPATSTPLFLYNHMGDSGFSFSGGCGLAPRSAWSSFCSFISFPVKALFALRGRQPHRTSVALFFGPLVAFFIGSQIGCNFFRFHPREIAP